MFQGSKHMPRDSHFQLLEAAGASGINGTTDFDRTNYFETVPANQLELALWLESDRMGYLLDSVDETALVESAGRRPQRAAAERPRTGRTASSKKRWCRCCFRRGIPTTATSSDRTPTSRRRSSKTCKQFFKRYYAPEQRQHRDRRRHRRAQVEAALVTKYFGSLKRGPAVPPITADDAEASRPSGERSSRIASSCRGCTWRGSRRRSSSRAMPMRTSRREVLGGGRSSRLYKKLVYEKQIAQNVNVCQQSLDARVDVPDSGDGAARPHRRGARAGDRRGARRRSERVRPTRGEVERARNTHRDASSAVSSVSSGFGGVADRAELLQPLPRHARLPAAGHRALSRRHARVACWRSRSERLTQTARGSSSTPCPETPDARRARCRRRPRQRRRRGAGAESVNADEPWRNEMPKPGAGEPFAAGDARRPRSCRTGSR